MGRRGVIGVVIGSALLLSFGWGCGGSEDAARTGSTAVAGTIEARSAFISTVMADTEDCWTEHFRSMDRVYDRPVLVLFRGVAPASSEGSVAATGPFYSPDDGTIYLDLAFYADLQEQYGALGDAAQAYVVAHEVGHAVQDRLGVLAQVEAAGAKGSEALRVQLRLRTELQADFYAGLAARCQDDLKWLREGDIEKAIAAADAAGNRYRQLLEEGLSMPDTLTHGTLAQRVRWFTLGYESGDLDRGDTFAIPYSEL